MARSEAERPHLSAATSFSLGPARKVSKTKCQEGFRCVSKIARFGYGHYGEVDPAGGAGVADRTIEDYEWGCPGENRVWRMDEFVRGSELGTCRAEQPRDCLCISKGSSDSISTMEHGHEKVQGWFDVQTSRPDGLIEKHQLTVIPHYTIRLLPSSLHPEDVHGEIGDVVALPRDQWMEKYAEMAPRMQISLDSLRKILDEDFMNKVQDKPFVCGTSMWPDETPSFNQAQVREALVRIRRFQQLSADCAMMRDNAAKIFPDMDEEQFFGQVPGTNLNCYMKKGTAKCQQLNCYRGFDDALFRARLHDFKVKMEQCKPEGDFPAFRPPEKMPKIERRGAGAGAVALASLASDGAGEAAGRRRLRRQGGLRSFL